MARRLRAMLAVAALATGLLLVPAIPASAASVADYVGLGAYATVQGRTPGGSWQSYTAGEMMLRIDGGSDAVGYCVDLHTGISTSTGHGLDEVDWVTSGIANLDQVSFILHTYDSSSPALPGTADQKAAAIQAAIWHLTDEFELETTGTDPDVVAGYHQILASIPAGGLVEPAPSLSVEPASLTGEEGDLLGPFTVTTTGTDLALVIPEGVEVLDWSTGDPITTVSDGSTFGIRLAEPGTVSVSMSTTATIHAGRAFAKLDVDGSPIVQRLILAEATNASTSAAVSATFTEATTTTTTEPTTTTTEPTTTTTEPEETTTTQPEETTTTQPEATTSSSVAPTSTEQVLGAVVERNLPRTGSAVREMVWVAAALVTAGALALATRHRLAVR